MTLLEQLLEHGGRVYANGVRHKLVMRRRLPGTIVVRSSLQVLHGEGAPAALGQAGTLTMQTWVSCSIPPAKIPTVVAKRLEAAERKLWAEAYAADPEARAR